MFGFRETTMRPPHLFNVLPLVLASCSSGPTLEEASCPPGGTTLTYENFGKSFLDTHCQGCHGGARDRKGAPSGYSFSTRAEAHEFRDRIFARAAMSNTTMPPGPDDPPRAERDKLGEWLACGAP